MPYCENCGTQINDNANFCRKCGAKQKPHPQPAAQAAPAPSYPVQPQMPPQETPEQIQSFLIAYRNKRFGGEEYFTGVLTSKRMIFAPMSKDLLNEVTNITRQQVKGKMPPMNAYPYQQNYLVAGPQAILSQTPGSFAVENSTIRQIKLGIVSTAGDGYADSWEFEMQIVTDSSTYTYRMTKRDEYVTRLKQVYQDKVTLPKNYVVR